MRLVTPNTDPDKPAPPTLPPLRQFAVTTLDDNGNSVLEASPAR